MNASSSVNSKRGRKPGRNSNKNGEHKGDMKAKLGKVPLLYIMPPNVNLHSQ